MSNVSFTVDGLPAVLSPQQRPSDMQRCTTIEQLQMKVGRERQARVLQQRAAACASLDDMAKGAQVTRRDIFKKVLTKQRKNARGCTTLPVTIAFVGLYALAARLHEDITNVFLLESALHRTFEPRLAQLKSLDDVWDWLSHDVPAILFVQEDDFNEALAPEEWSRVLIYSQVQGSVRIRQARANSAPWGVAYHGPVDSYIAMMNESTEGFVAVSSARQASQWGSNSQGVPPGTRRLAELMRPEILDSLPGFGADDATYDVHLVPGMSTEEIRARISYLQHRQWLDRGTRLISLKALLLNAELGRPRLERVVIKIAMSRGGALFYRVELECLFLAVFPPGLAAPSVDVLWVMMLCISTHMCIQRMWDACREERLKRYFRLSAALEWLIIIIGWLNVVDLYRQHLYIVDLNEKLDNVRHLRVRGTEAQQQQADLELTASAEDMSSFMSIHRLVVSWYNIVLIFRFFVAFRVQPRLAVVTNTLMAVGVDFLHFLFVFTPSFFAYAISGNVLFGRRMQEFSTIKASTGIMFRILYENEYPWAELSKEYYYSTAIWVWSYLVFVVLVMLNLVLAIILDTYNEVRANTNAAETLLLFLEQVKNRLVYYRQWVANDDLEGLISEMDTLSTIEKNDLQKVVPKMTQLQRDMIFQSCRNEMAWETRHDVHPLQLFRFQASVKFSMDELDQALTKLTGPKVSRFQRYASEESTMGASRQKGCSRPFPGMPTAPGGFIPPLLPPGPVALPPRDTVASEDEPEGVEELRAMMNGVNDWLMAVQWQLSSLQWKWHQVLCQQNVAPTRTGTQSVAEEPDWPGPTHTPNGMMVL